jgi:hypothetical protein
MLQEGIIVLGIHQHHCAIVVLQIHPVKDFFEVLISQLVPFAKLLQGKSIFKPASASVLKDVSNQSQIPVINFYPRLNVAIYLLSMEHPLVPRKAMRRQLVLPAEVRNL